MAGFADALLDRADSVSWAPGLSLPCDKVLSQVS